MKKIVRITEEQINRIVSKTMSEQFEMGDTTPRRDYKPTPREKQVKGVFGSYSEDIPPTVIRYMRKNPDKIVKRLYDIYGESIYDWIDADFPLDEATYNVDVDNIDKIKDKLPQDAEVNIIDEEDDLLDEGDDTDITSWDDVPMMK